MDSELTSILKSIKQKTGVDIDVFAETMKFTASTRQTTEVVLPSRIDFNEVFCDTRTDRTFFKVRFRNAKLIGSITGTGETEKNYAYLILTILENSSARDDESSKDEKLKRIVYGDYSRHQIQKYMREYNVPDDRCYALAISNDQGRTGEVYSYVQNKCLSGFDSLILTDEMTCTLIKFIKSDEEDFSCADYAESLYSAIVAETGIEVLIGVGNVVENLLDANVSYTQAISALRVSGYYALSNHVHSYKDYMLIKILEDVPKFKLSEYLDFLLDAEGKSIFNDPDMIQTAEAFLENDLNVSEAARELYMHRNTLMYRLNKIEHATKLNIKKFPDAVTFRLITIIRKLLG